MQVQSTTSVQIQVAIFLFLGYPILTFKWPRLKINVLLVIVAHITFIQDDKRNTCRGSLWTKLIKPFFSLNYVFDSSGRIKLNGKNKSQGIRKKILVKKHEELC